MKARRLIMPSAPTPFPNTRWTLVQKLRQGSPADSRAALDTLCKAYWAPLYAVARYDRMTEHDAQDAVQGFFLMILRRDIFAKADAAEGKLRNLLLKSFKNFCTNEWRKTQSLKRGDGAEHVPLHDITGTEERFAKEMHSPGLSAEKIYAREWARTVLDRSLDALRRHYAQRGQSERFALFERPLLQADDASSLNQLATDAGMQPGAVRTGLHRMRSHYRECIEIEIATTLDTEDPAIIQAEIMALFQAFE